MNDKKNQNNVVKGNIGTIIGSGNTQNIIMEPHGQNESFDIPADSVSDYLVLFGRWLWKKYGKTKFSIMVGIPFLGSLSTLLFSIYQMTIIPPETISTVSFIILIGSGIISTLLWKLLDLSNNRTCQNCNEHFAYREYKPRKHLGEGSHKGTIYHKIKQFLKCDFCKDIWEPEYIDPEEIRED